MSETATQLCDIDGVQPRGRLPAVEYVPGDPAPERPSLPRRRELPRPARSRRR